MRFLPKFLNRMKERTITAIRKSFGISGGSYVNEDSSMQASAFYRGVIYLSTSIAKLPWNIKDSKRNIIDDHNVSYLLNLAPNEEMTAFSFKLFMIQCAIIHGNGYAEIERYMDGRPKALWPINPHRVFPVRDNDGVLWYRVTNSGWNGEDVFFKPKDVLIFKNFHTKDGFQGQGVVGYAMDTLGISLGADKFANSLFANGGMPSGVLEYPGKLDDEAFARLKESWSESNGGRKTGNTAILEDGVKYQPVSFAPDVLQFLESRKFNVSEIARFLGIPPTKLFDSHAAKFNNVEHSNLEVASDTLDAWCKNLETEADVKLLNNQYKGFRTQLDLYELFRGDMDTRSQYFSRMMQAGAITPNQIREREGMAGYKGGDRYYIAVNNFTPQDRVDEVIDSRVAPKLALPNTPVDNPKTDPAGSPTNESDEELMTAARERLARILKQN